MNIINMSNNNYINKRAMSCTGSATSGKYVPTAIFQNTDPKSKSEPKSISSFNSKVNSTTSDCVGVVSKAKSSSLSKSEDEDIMPSLQSTNQTTNQSMNQSNESINELMNGWILFNG